MDGHRYFFESSAIDHLLGTCCEAKVVSGGGEEDTSTTESVTLTVVMVFVLAVLVGF